MNHDETKRSLTLTVFEMKLLLVSIRAAKRHAEGLKSSQQNKVIDTCLILEQKLSAHI